MIALVDRGESTIRHLLDYAKQWTPQLQDCVVLALVEEACAQMARKGGLAAVEVTIEGDGDLRARLDPTLTQQVFWNLMENAVQAMPEGGGVALDGG